MPILIQELVITAVVEPESARRVEGEQTGEGREQLIEACAAETLKILREKRER